MFPCQDVFLSKTISTSDIPPPERLTAYREMLGGSIGAFEVDAPGNSLDFRARCFSLSGLGLAHIASSGVRVTRKSEAQVDHRRDLVFAVVHQGSASISQRGRELTLEGSGAFLASNREPLAMHRHGARLTNYSLCSRDLAPMLADLDQSFLRAIPLDNEAVKLLVAYSKLAIHDGLRGASALHHLATRHVYDLIVLALGPTRDSGESAARSGLAAARKAELYSRARRLIALHSGKADLGPSAIAGHLGVGLRVLQKVFADRSETLMGVLWDERVSRAASLLSSQGPADRSVTDIAFACGFNDSSHFARVFAARKGMTPSQWRKQSV